jgi:hypothetical protein
MSALLILCIALGLISYWIVKVPAVIHGVSAINTVKDFFRANWKECLLSAIGAILLCVAGNDIPESWGKITGPVTAFIAGGSLPSMIMNLTGLFKK